MSHLPTFAVGEELAWLRHEVEGLLQRYGLEYRLFRDGGPHPAGARLILVATDDLGARSLHRLLREIGTLVPRPQLMVLSWDHRTPATVQLPAEWTLALPRQEPEFVALVRTSYESRAAQVLALPLRRDLPDALAIALRRLQELASDPGEAFPPHEVSHLASIVNVSRSGVYEGASALGVHLRELSRFAIVRRIRISAEARRPSADRLAVDLGVTPRTVRRWVRSCLGVSVGRVGTIPFGEIDARIEALLGGAVDPKGRPTGRGPHGPDTGVRSERQGP